jgi:hypothetical protein
VTGALEALDVAPDGAALLNEAHETLTRYVIFPSPEAADAAALFAATTHAAHEFEFATRLVIRSPVKRCGKSRLEDVLAGLVQCPLLTANISAASLVHSIDPDNPPVIMLDEADTIFGKALKGDEKAEHLRGILNAGFTRDRPYMRYDPLARKNMAVPTFAMAVVAGIGSMPDTIEDRAVCFTMRRKAPGETVSKYRIRRDKPAVMVVGQRLGAWVSSIAGELGAAEPEMPAGLNDRAEDAWESLLAVADAAGGDWPVRARKAAAVLAAEAEEDAAEGMRLLADLRDVFGDADKLWTETILASLHDVPEAPWGDWFGHPLKDRELAKLLKPYGIRSRDVKIDGTNHKGYYREQFVKSWESYVGGTSATGATGATAQASGQIEKATQGLPSATGEAPNGQVALGSPQVADAKPPLTSDVAQVAPVADTPPVCARCGEAHHRYGDNGRPCRTVTKEAQP